MGANFFQAVRLLTLLNHAVNKHSVVVVVITVFSQWNAVSSFC